MLTKEGANAFLKTLEEPPPHAVFILATTEPEKLPVTILSRCQRYAFRRISMPVMIERMKTIAAAEKIAIDDEALAAIAYRADGGLRDALTMLEQARSLCRREAGHGRDARPSVWRDRAHVRRTRSWTRSLRAMRRRALGVDRRGERRRHRYPRADPLADRRVSQSAGRARRSGAARARPCRPKTRSVPSAQRRCLSSDDRPRAAHVLAKRLRSRARAETRGSNSKLRCCASFSPSEDPTLDALAARVTALEERPAAGSAPPVPEAATAVGEPPVAAETPPAAATEPAPAAAAEPAAAAPRRQSRSIAAARQGRVAEHPGQDRRRTPAAERAAVARRDRRRREQRGRAQTARRVERRNAAGSYGVDRSRDRRRARGSAQGAPESRRYGVAAGGCLAGESGRALRLRQRTHTMTEMRLTR